jgi:ethanolamine ammonia-lyase large subunit
VKSVSSVGEQLQIELERLKRLTGTGVELKVLHCPKVESRVSGEVKEETVLIYESNSTKALDALKHEFIDYLVSKAIKPYEKATRYYRTMINALISELGEDAYNEKEKVVEALRRTIS